MSIEQSKERFLSWFTGKAREKASQAFDQVVASQQQGGWVQGSRSIKAALDKANLPRRLGRAFGRDLENMTGYGGDIPDTQRGYAVSHLLCFPYVGSIGGTRSRLDWGALRGHATAYGVRRGDAALAIDLTDAINQAARLVTERRFKTAENEDEVAKLGEAASVRFDRIDVPPVVALEILDVLARFHVRTEEVV